MYKSKYIFISFKICLSFSSDHIFLTTGSRPHRFWSEYRSRYFQVKYRYVLCVTMSCVLEVCQSIVQGEASDPLPMSPISSHFLPGGGVSRYELSPSWGTEADQRNIREV